MYCAMFFHNLEIIVITPFLVMFEEDIYIYIYIHKYIYIYIAKPVLEGSEIAIRKCFFSF